MVCTKNPTRLYVRLNAALIAALMATQGKALFSHHLMIDTSSNKHLTRIGACPLIVTAAVPRVAEL